MRRYSVGCLDFYFDEETGEVYRDLAPLGFLGYRVGADGSFWSSWKHLGVYASQNGGRVALGENWTQRRGYASPKGYVSVELNQGRRISLHRLILTAFVGPCPPGLECRHLDGNPANNRLENICWGTQFENTADRFRHGTQVVGSRVGTAKMTEETVREIKRLYGPPRGPGARPRGRLTMPEVAQRLGITEGMVQHVISGEAWKHVS